MPAPAVTPSAASEESPSFPASMRLGSIAGIEIRADASLLIIFALVLFGLGAGVFPAWHPEWGAGTIWLTALAAAVLFFASILVHELSHAVVGRLQGMRIPRITLFVFGGMAHMEREPHAWRAELWMAIVGPVVSLAIGAAALFAGNAALDAGALDPEDPLGALASAGPLATMALWLGPVNILLGLFNLVPGFPLDGGRVLRAILWGATGDVVRATRWAAGIGQAFGWFLIACGFLMVFGLRLPVLGTGLVAGVWVALIGWFLARAAAASYAQLVVGRSLEHVPVSRLMLAPVETVSPATPVDELIEEHLMRSDQRLFPVLESGRMVGVVGIEEARAVPREARGARRVGDVMTPASRLPVVSPREDSAQALRKLSRFPTLPVLEGGELRGLLRREDIAKWLLLRSDTPLPG
jgi:Zn-dependent protease/predicted transcriptional regulator